MGFRVPEKKNGENGREYAYRVLYGAIMSLELEPGAQLADAELSAALKISRTPIREAIVSLTEAKLVEVRPQRSSCVSRIDIDAVEEGIFLRCHAERGIVREAAEKAEQADFAVMHANLQRQKECLEAKDADGFMDADNEFHHLMYLAAGKPWTWTAVTRIVTHQDRVRRLQARTEPETLEKSYQEHCVIFNSLMARNPEEADRMLTGHITAGYRSSLPELLRIYPGYFSV